MKINKSQKERLELQTFRNENYIRKINAIQGDENRELKICANF